MSHIIDASTRALQQTAASAVKTLAQLQATVDGQLVEIQNNANTLVDQSNLISANEKRIENEVREAAAEIRLQVKEDEDSVLSDLLGERGLISIEPAVFEQLKDRAIEAEDNVEATIKNEVAKAESALHARYKAELNTVAADHKVELATLNANSGRDADLIAGLKTQVAELQETIRLNREAETARTQALAQSSVTVNNAR